MNMTNFFAHVGGLLKGRPPQYSNALEPILRYSDSLLAVTTDKGEIVDMSREIKNMMAVTQSGSCDQFLYCLDESSHYDYLKALEYITRESKPVIGIEVDTLSSLRKGTMMLYVFPLPAQQTSEVCLLHLLANKQDQLRASTDYSHIEKLTNVGQIAAGIAHELNTPLGSIILSASSIIDASERPEVVEESTRIKKRAEHCSTVVKELLGYVRHGDKGREKHNLLAIVNKVTGLTTSECKQRNIQLSTKHDVDNLVVPCNENQLEQVLFNLINNAIYAIEEQGTIEISVRHDDLLKRAHLEVKDNGQGIPLEHREKIFDPFFTTKPGAQGTGLGLALCRKIIVEHGGDISVQSIVGKETTFDVWLPLNYE